MRKLNAVRPHIPINLTTKVHYILKKEGDDSSNEADEEYVIYISPNFVTLLLRASVVQNSFNRVNLTRTGFEERYEFEHDLESLNNFAPA